jgi:hypothetical protein
VIPSGDMDGLGCALDGAELVNVAQHGVDHQNRRTGAAAGEFADDWSRGRLAVELARGWTRIASLPRARRLFVPPWNDVHPALEAALQDCGFFGWSAEGAIGAEDQGPEAFPRLDVHLDLMRWRGGARFRGRRRFLAGLRRELARRRKARLWDAPIGLLSHHLAHDEPAWDFLGEFLQWSRAHPQLGWADLPSLMPPAEPAARTSSMFEAGATEHRCYA